MLIFVSPNDTSKNDPIVLLRRLFMRQLYFFKNSNATNYAIESRIDSKLLSLIKID